MLRNSSELNLHHRQPQKFIPFLGPEHLYRIGKESSDFLNAVNYRGHVHTAGIEHEVVACTGTVYSVVPEERDIHRTVEHFSRGDRNRHVRDGKCCGTAGSHIMATGDQLLEDRLYIGVSGSSWHDVRECLCIFKCETL